MKEISNLYIEKLGSRLEVENFSSLFFVCVYSFYVERSEITYIFDLRGGCHVGAYIKARVIVHLMIEVSKGRGSSTIK